MPTPIPPPGSNFITRAKFLEMKKFYADNYKSLLVPQYKDQDILVYTETFNLDIITAITEVDGYAGFRIVYGMSPDMKVHAMLVAINKDGEDILPDAAATFEKNNIRPTGGGVAGEESQRCPPTCG